MSNHSHIIRRPNAALIFRHHRSPFLHETKWRESFAIIALMASVALQTLPLANAQDGGFNFGNRPAEETTDLEIQSDASSFDQNLGIAKAAGNVVVTYEDVTIYADEVEYHRDSGKVFARGNVRVYRGGEVVDAEEVIYTVPTGEMTTSQLKSSFEPLFYSAGSIERPEEASDGPIILKDTSFTTHDSANPNYRFKVNKLEAYPDDRIVMHGARLFIGDTPTLYFPYYVQPMNADLGYYFTPGWNSAWGGFLLNQYGFMIGDRVLATTHLDVRSERGLAGGIEFEDRKFNDNDQIGTLNLYYADDANPQRRFNGRARTNNIKSKRYRLNLQHRVYFPGSEDETFYIDFDLHRLSDAFVLEDFFPADYRIDPKPDNLINITKLFDQGEISLLGRFQVNDFFQTDTRTPELSVDFIRTPIGDTGFFYNGMTSYGVIDEDLADVDIAAGMVDPSGYNRFHTYHEFLFPTQLGGVLNVVPRVGGGYRHYSDFDLPGIDTFESTIFHAGVDLSFKMSKKSPHVYNKALGLDGLMHVVRPYMNYSFVSTDEINGRFTPIDRFTRTTRLRPIDLPLFTSIDDFRDWQIIRTGISQKWFTRRDGATYEWLSLNNYMDIYLDDPEFNRDTSNFFTELEWNPVPWLTASTTAQVPLFGDGIDFSEIDSNLTFMPNDRFRFGVGHYHLNNHPFFLDADLYTLSTYTRLSDDWGLGTNHRFESDDGTLEFQQYTIHRDMASWTASLGAIVRDNRDGENEVGFLLSLTLKAFPRLSLPVDFQPGNLGAE